MDTCEAVWIAGRDPKYIAEACASARSFKRHHPAWPTHLFTPDAPHKVSDFTRVTHVEYNRDLPWYLNLVRWYQLLPDLADRIYLFDTDTRICASLWGPLRLLQNGYDFLGVHAPGRHTCKSVVDEVSKVEFPEINVGFLAFNGNDSVHTLFRIMLDLYEGHPSLYNGNDQGPLRDALWKRHGHFYVLPTEYNFRYAFGGQVRGKVRVLHGRSSTPPDGVERIVNASGDIRAFLGSQF